MAEIKEALDLLKNEGYKLTAKRQDLLELLSHEDRYLAVKEIYEKMLDQHPSISLDTIYRNLQTYSDLHLIEETEFDGEKVYRFRCNIHEHHHHFICTACGKTKELLTCPMEIYEDQLPGYTVKEHRFEIFGLCDQCSLKENL